MNENGQLLSLSNGRINLPDSGLNITDHDTLTAILNKQIFHPHNFIGINLLGSALEKVRPESFQKLADELMRKKYPFNLAMLLASCSSAEILTPEQLKKLGFKDDYTFPVAYVHPGFPEWTLCDDAEQRMYNALSEGGYILYESAGSKPLLFKMLGRKVAYAKYPLRIGKKIIPQGIWIEAVGATKDKLVNTFSANQNRITSSDGDEFVILRCLNENSLPGIFDEHNQIWRQLSREEFENMVQEAADNPPAPKYLFRNRYSREDYLHLVQN